MRTRSRQSFAGVSRRDLFRTGGLMAAGLTGAQTVHGADAKISSPGVYTRIGVRPLSTAPRRTPLTAALRCCRR